VSPEQLLRGESLLGDHAQLCAAFFHTHASSEAGNDELCLDPTRCVRKPNVVLVARLERVLADESSEPLYTCRYTNCMARQPRGGRQAVHAEQFMLDDARLHALLRAEPLAAAEGPSDGGGEHGETTKEQPRKRPRQRPHLRLTLLLTQQPCHFSSGRVENAHATAKTSCSIRLIEWLQRERLHERRVELCIKLSRIFRAHWTDDAVHTTEAERVVFSGRASAAREGLVLLMQAGWRIEMLSPEDWNFLIGLSDPYVGRGEGEAVDERSGERCGVCASEAATGPPEAEAKAGEGQGIETMDTQACAEEHPLPSAPTPPPAPPPPPPPATPPPPPPPCTCLFRSDVDATNMSFANEEGRAVQWWEAPLLADGGMGAPWRRVSDPTLAEGGGHGNGLREGTGKILMNASQVALAMRVVSTDVVSAPRSRGARRAVVTRACQAKRDGQDAYFVSFLAELDARVRARGQHTDRHHDG
jgi:hypothetical protein